MIPLEKSSRAVLKNCLDLKPKETLLIVVDKSLAEIGETVWKTAQKLSKTTTLLKFSNGNDHKLPDVVKDSIHHVDTCLILSSNSLDARALERARHQGARIIALQNVQRNLVERCFETNYKKISILSRKLSDLFSIGKSMQVTTPSGTDAQITISRLKGVADTGLVHKAGQFAYLPAGEACIILNHKHIDGRVTIDRVAGTRKKLEQPITLNIKDGEITRINGEQEADELRKSIRKFGKAGRQVYEFGVGTNHQVKFGNSAQEDEKALGAIHLSFGQNKTTKVQGKMIQAIKGILLKPTIHIDGRIIMEEGKVVV